MHCGTRFIQHPPKFFSFPFLCLTRTSNIVKVGCNDIQFDSSKPNIRGSMSATQKDVDRTSFAEHEQYLIYLALHKPRRGNIRLSMLANYARSSSQARTHPVARMEATEAYYSFLPRRLRAQHRREKSFSIQANAWANVYRRRAEEANRSGKGEDLGKQFVLSRESTFDPWERVVHRGQPFLVPVAGSRVV